MDVHLWQLRYVIAVAEELNFTRAAARLHMSQPALSTRIRELEEQLGVALFTRSTRRVELTPAGAELARRGRALLADAQLAVTATRNAGVDDPRLVVGLLGTAGTSLFPLVAEAIRRERPAATLDVRVLAGPAQVAAGEVELAFSRLEPDETELILLPLLRERRVLALAAGHPLADARQLALADLRGEAFLTQRAENNPSFRRRWLAEQRRAGLPGTIAHEVTDAEELFALLSSGRGVCLVPESTARAFPRPGLAFVRVRDADTVGVTLAWRAAADQPFLREVVAAAQAVAAAQLAAPDQDAWMAP